MAGWKRAWGVHTISATRPITVWHRSAQAVQLKSAAVQTEGITREWCAGLPEGPRKQGDCHNAHYGSRGCSPCCRSSVGPSPRPRTQGGLRFVGDYYHAKGVTLGAEPAGLMSKSLQEAQNAVHGDPASPFRFDVIAAGKPIAGRFADAQVGMEPEKLFCWGKG